MNKVLFITMGLLFILAQDVLAFNYICGSPTALYQYSQYIDPASVPACPPPFTISVLDDPVVIAQQDALYKAVAPRYIKVPTGLMVEMTQVEKDAVDKPANDKRAADEAARAEMAASPVCANNTLPEIDAYWKGPGSKQAALQASMTTFQTSINAMTAGTAKTAQQNAYNSLLLLMNMFIDDSNLSWRSTCSHQFVQP